MKFKEMLLEDNQGRHRVSDGREERIGKKRGTE